MLAKVHTAATTGMTTVPVCVEVTNSRASSQESKFFMVGLPDNAVRESRTRIYAALENQRLRIASGNYSINFAPADVKKEGTGYDLPLAIGLTACCELVPLEALADTMLVGELGLDGTVRPVRGCLPIAIEARRRGLRRLIVPKANAREAAVVDTLQVYGADTLAQVVDFLRGEPAMEQTIVHTREEFYAAQATTGDDFCHVKGQESVKRAMEVAAAGGHNIILVGSPGCGKSMMAKCLPSILPQLTLAESLETTQLHSIAGKLRSDSSLISVRPFRAPHHTISDVALIGGGQQFQPGEISLAHNGVLFLDELPEFSRTALETLRQPLEDREITISRAKYTATLPCSFMLVASMNPCPCGYYHHPSGRCHCLPGQIQRYMGKISGPLLDRIDLQVEVQPVPIEDMASAPQGEPSAAIRERVAQARGTQEERFRGVKGVHCNAQMSAALIEKYALPTPEAVDCLRQAMRQRDLSARSYNRILKVARTIADLAHSPHVERAHIAEAVGYRNLDRETWGE